MLTGQIIIGQINGNLSVLSQVVGFKNTIWKPGMRNFTYI